MAAPNGLIVAWPSTAASIPTGWSRYTNLDDRVPKPASASITTTGGSDTHTHTASHTHTDSHTHTQTSGGPDLTNTVSGASDLSAATSTHTHSVTSGTPSTTQTTSTPSATTTAADSSLGFSRVSVIWIQSNGTTDIPVNAVAYSSASSVPAGYSAYSNGINAYLRGAAAAADGGTVTAATGHSSHNVSHTHTLAATAHTHVSATSSSASAGANRTSQPTLNVAFDGSGHTHNTTWASATHGADTSGSASATFTSTTIDLQFIKLQTVQATSAVPAPRGIVALWTTTTPPSGWVACDGGNGSVNVNGSGAYLKGANGTGEIGSTGGSNSHSHTANAHSHTLAAGSTGAHSITYDATSTGANTHKDIDSSNSGAAKGHAHTATRAARDAGSTSSDSTGAASASHDPAYINMFFIMSLGEDHPLPWWRTARSNYVRR